MDDVEQLRMKLRQMTNPQLRDFGNDMRKLCKAARKLGQEPSLENTVPLEEESAEWRRRQLKARVENTK
jgi:hypothetical protein